MMWMEIFEQALMSDQFAERFKEIVNRAKGDRSQSALARELGVSSSTVQKWLSGNGHPSSENMAKIAKKAGLSGSDALLNYLKGQPESSGADTISPQEIFLLTKKLSKVQRKRLIELILEDL